MDVRHLRVFLAIVDAGGMTKAARALHLSQPSVSQTLRALEQEYGVRLFHRIGRRLELSSAGEALVGPARQVVRSMELAADQVAKVTDLQSGWLDVGAHSMLASDPLGEIIGLFHRSYPGVSIRIRDAADTRGLVSLVRDGSCEIGLTFLPVRNRDLVAEPIGWQEFHVILPPGTRVPTGPLTMSELSEVSWVVPPIGSPTRTMLDRAFTEAGVTLRIAVEATPRDRTLPFVLAGVGAALYPSALAARSRMSGAIVREPYPPMKREMGVVYRGRELSPAAKAFTENLAPYLEEIRARFQLATQPTRPAAPASAAMEP